MKSVKKDETIKNENSNIIVKDFDTMLKLIDQDYEVKEEINGPVFIMQKKKLKIKI